MTNPDVTPAAESVSTPESDALVQLRAELERVRAEAIDANDRFLRAKAEADNIRRRAELDVQAAHKFAVDRFSSEVVAVRDSLDLARQVEIRDDHAVQKMHEGLELTLKLLDSVFQKFGITLIDPTGQKFDPSRHQAISMVESAETPPNHVVNVVQKGYLIHDRLLRPAMVTVAKDKAPSSPGEGASGA